jgi:tyrosine-protein kinase Etk/Wzc
MESQQLTIKDIINAVLKNLNGVIIIFILLLGLFAFSYITSPRIYQSTSLIQIEDSSEANLFSGSQTFFNFGSNDLTEEIQLYKSRSNLSVVINKLQLNMALDGMPLDAVKNKFFDNISISELNLGSLGSSLQFITFSLSLRENNFSVINSNGEEIISNAKYNSDITSAGGNNVFRIDRKTKNYNNGTHSITIFNEDTASKMLLLSVTVAPVVQRAGLKSTLLNVTHISPYTDHSRRVITALNNQFLEEKIRKNSLRATASLRFIDERISEIEEQLKIDQNELNAFKESNLLFEQEDEGKLLYDQLLSVQEKINLIELEEIEARSKYKEENPITVNLLSQRRVLEERKETILSEISSLPVIQQKFIDLSSKVQVNTTILDLLLGKRVEFAILEASTLSGVSIIDSPYVSKFVSPIFINNLIFFLIIAGFLSSVYVVIRSLIFRSFKYASSLADLSDGKFLGAIPVLKDIENLSQKEKDAINGITINLEIILGKTGCFMVTGPTKGVGKTTASILLAESLADQGSKILLIDGDYRQGNVHKKYGLRKFNIENLNKINFSDLKVKENLYLLPCLKNSADTSMTIFKSEIFSDIINKAKETFDYILFDTPPILSLSDAIAITRYTSHHLIICREDVSQPQQFLKARELIGVTGSEEVYSIYNAMKPSKSIVGYSYYDYYSYKYYEKSYDYQTED